MADPQPITWPELLDFQARVVSRRQAASHGVSRGALSNRSKSGAWQRLQRGAYATFSGVPPREARLWAAVLRAGPGAILSHETAAEVHGLIDKPSKIIHITVPASRKPAESGKIPGVVIHRSRRVVRQALPPWQLPRTPVAETVLDLVAASASFDDAYSWLSRATGRRLVSAGMIKEAMAARTRMRWREWLIDALHDVDDGVMFPLELRYVRDVERAHGLPAARRQARRELAGGVRYLDNFYDVYRLCVELDGRSSHPPEQKWQDADRDNDNLFAGDVQTVRFGVRDVTVRRCARAGQLAAALMRRGWDGVGLHGCGARCQVTARNSPGSAEVPRILRSS
jgi:Transcriptional regulator, AbiEi antitoxin